MKDRKGINFPTAKRIKGLGCASDSASGGAGNRDGNNRHNDHRKNGAGSGCGDKGEATGRRGVPGGGGGAH